MSRTRHSSNDGVRAYKSASNKLKQVTSDVLNYVLPTPKQAVSEEHV